MRKFIKNLFGMIGGIALFLACSEAETATAQLLWSGGCLAVCWISYKVWEALATPEELEEKV